jgi:hypothetical protein
MIRAAQLLGLGRDIAAVVLAIAALHLIDAGADALAQWWLR